MSPDSFSLLDDENFLRFGPMLRMKLVSMSMAIEPALNEGHRGVIPDDTS